MTLKTYRRGLAIASLSIVGAVAAFSAGAKVGSQLDHQTHRVSVARIPVGDRQPTIEEPVAPPPAVVANK